MNILDMANQFKQNPMAMLSKRFNIPGNMNDPNEIIQHLLNTGQVSQAQVNQAMSMRNNPMFKGLF
ncbi:MAG: hypothetical protein J6S49_02025 [Erysipelotrichaceae bacterium]|nr:hypothetical protein [Erysipelotrichaceae bacterium]